MQNPKENGIKLGRNEHQRVSKPQTQRVLTVDVALFTGSLAIIEALHNKVLRKASSGSCMKVIQNRIHQKTLGNYINMSERDVIKL